MPLREGEYTYDLQPPAYRDIADQERCQWPTVRGSVCRYAWLFRRSDTDPTPVCRIHTLIPGMRGGRLR